MENNKIVERMLAYSLATEIKGDELNQVGGGAGGTRVRTDIVTDGGRDVSKDEYTD